MQGDINIQGTTVNINIYIQILCLCTSYIIAYHANCLELFYKTIFILVGLDAPAYLYLEFLHGAHTFFAT